MLMPADGPLASKGRTMTTTINGRPVNDVMVARVDGQFDASDTPSEAGATYEPTPDGVPVAVDPEKTPSMGTREAAESEAEAAREHIRSERAKQEMRRRIPLPVMGEAWTESTLLREHVKVNLMELWFRLPTHVLGELSQEPGLHATIMNAHTHLEEAGRMIERRVGKVNEWMETFKTIAALGQELGAWEYVEQASGALVDGPFSDKWEQSVEWFQAAWEPPMRPSEMAMRAVATAAGAALGQWVASKLAKPAADPHEPARPDLSGWRDATPSEAPPMPPIPSLPKCEYCGESHKNAKTKEQADAIRASDNPLKALLDMAMAGIGKAR